MKSKQKVIFRADGFARVTTQPTVTVASNACSTFEFRRSKWEKLPRFN